VGGSAFGGAGSAGSAGSVLTGAAGIGGTSCVVGIWLCIMLKNCATLDEVPPGEVATAGSSDTSLAAATAASVGSVVVVAVGCAMLLEESAAGGAATLSAPDVLSRWSRSAMSDRSAES